MNLQVEAVSTKFGPSFCAGGIWYNADKKAMPDLSTIRRGDELEAEVNGKWVKSFTIVSRGAVNEAPAGKKDAYAKPIANKEKDAQFIRRDAANAAFGSAFALYSKDGDEAEAVQKSLDIVEKVAEFIENGREVVNG